MLILFCIDKTSLKYSQSAKTQVSPVLLFVAREPDVSSTILIDNLVPTIIMLLNNILFNNVLNNRWRKGWKADSVVEKKQFKYIVAAFLSFINYNIERGVIFIGKKCVISSSAFLEYCIGKLKHCFSFAVMETLKDNGENINYIVFFKRSRHS